MKLRHYILIIIIFILLGGRLYYNYQTSINMRISRDLEIEMPYRVKFSHINTQGWFGDGENLAKAKIEEKHIDKIKNHVTRKWRKTPLPKNIKIALYGNKDYISRLAQDLGMPIIKNGYWIFIDRHGGRIREFNNGDKIFTRSSANYSFAMFDMDTDMFYYITFDS